MKPTRWLMWTFWGLVVALLNGYQAPATGGDPQHVTARWLPATPENLWLEVLWEGPPPRGTPVVEAFLFGVPELPGREALGLLLLPEQLEVKEKSAVRVRWHVAFPNPNPTDGPLGRRLHVRVWNLDPPGVWRFDFDISPDV